MATEVPPLGERQDTTLSPWTLGGNPPSQPDERQSDRVRRRRPGTHWQSRPVLMHAERLLQKLMPATAKEERWAKVVRDLVWQYYEALKAYKQNPLPRSDADVPEARAFVLSMSW